MAEEPRQDDFIKMLNKREVKNRTKILQTIVVTAGFVRNSFAIAIL